VEDRTYPSQLTLPLSTPLVGALAAMTAAIGGAGWFDTVLDLLGKVCALDCGGAMAFYRHQRPRRIVHRFGVNLKFLPAIPQ